MQAEIEIEMLTKIVKSVFITMLDLDVSTNGIAWQPAGGRLTSFVQLTGDWNGAVLLECSRRLACQFAGRMLSVDPPETVDDDVRDVLGELANVIGGNMKSGMSTGVRLSMPTVMDGGDYGLRICGSELRERLTFECVAGHFWVTILVTDNERPEGIGRRSLPVLPSSDKLRDVCRTIQTEPAVPDRLILRFANSDTRL